MIYQIPVDQITGLAKYGLALSCTAVSDLAESDLARYAPPERAANFLRGFRLPESEEEGGQGRKGDSREIHILFLG